MSTNVVCYYFAIVTSVGHLWHACEKVIWTLCRHKSALDISGLCELIVALRNC